MQPKANRNITTCKLFYELVAATYMLLAAMATKCCLFFGLIAVYNILFRIFFPNTNKSYNQMFKKSFIFGLLVSTTL